MTNCQHDSGLSKLTLGNLPYTFSSRAWHSTTSEMEMSTFDVDFLGRKN
jgi:hypothetical protein